MNLTNKIFSLFGFAEPIPLQRANNTNLLAKEIQLCSIGEKVNVDIQQTLTQLPVNTTENTDNFAAQSIQSLVIDATMYIGESSYQRLYSIFQNTLPNLSYNAKILIIANATSFKQGDAENAFGQALIGFCKSLAKEVGRKGSTANVIFLSDQQHNISTALLSPVYFFLSSKSSFISGQTLTIHSDNKRLAQLSNNITNKKIAIVTGAAQGIGAAIASKLTEDGYHVIGVDIALMKTPLINTMQQLQGEYFILDVSANNAGNQLALLAKKYGKFDLIVHNAGITRDKTLAKMSMVSWQQTLDINLLSVMRINKILLAKDCISYGGRIVCLSSMNGIAGQGGQTNYACSKAGIIGYVNSISSKLAMDNIIINAVAPGFIDTQMTKKMPFFTREIGRRMNALGQGGLPIDVAEAVAFLGAKSNIAISGQTLRVCGLNIIGS